MNVIIVIVETEKLEPKVTVWDLRTMMVEGVIVGVIGCMDNRVGCAAIVPDTGRHIRVTVYPTLTPSEVVSHLKVGNVDALHVLRHVVFNLEDEEGWDAKAIALVESESAKARGES